MNADQATLAQLGHVLATHGLTATPHAIHDAAGELTLRGIVRALEKAGVDARIERVGPADVPRLPPTSLVWLDDGPPAMVLRGGPSGVVLELPTGETRAFAQRDLVRVRGRAVVVRRRQAKGGSFVSRVRAGLFGDPAFPRAALYIVVMGLLVTALGTATPLLSRVALSEAIPERAPAKVTAVAAFVLFVFVHTAWAGWLRRRALLFVEARVRALGVETFVEHVLGLPFSRLERLQIGEILEVSRVADAAAAFLPTLATTLLDGTISVVYLGLMFWLDAWSGLAALTGWLVLCSLGLVAGKRSFALRSAAMVASRDHQQTLYETIAGIETVKAEAAEERMLIRTLSRLVAHQGVGIKEQFESSAVSALAVVIDRLTYGLVLVLVARRALDDLANVGDLMAAIQASAAFFASAQPLARLPLPLAVFRAQVAQVDALLDLPTEAPAWRAPLPLAPRAEDAVVLRNVWFRYDPALPWLLKGMDVTVPRGATVVLEWPSGAGKSTLLRLIAGLLAPERGDVVVFGAEATRARSLVTYLPQHASLLPRSIRDNLRLLSGGAPDERIAQAAAATGLSSLVSSWPMGLETLVSAAGSNLSSGQRQLVIFTAAVASTAPLLLLDEAFAHMDGEMRARLATLELMRGRTVVAVVHDASARERAAPGTLFLGQAC